jgi:hypothetical protein
MARGVSPDDFNQAANALLAAGERPTVERVRLALGRGSPNTLGPMLDAWWAGLAQRLRARLAIPNLPEAVGEAFAQAWSVALAAGQAHAEGLVAPERAALADVLARTEAAAAAQASALSTLRAQLEQARAATRGIEATLAISEQRVADLKADLGALNERGAQLTRERDASEARRVSAEATTLSERKIAAAERDRLQGLLRQVEDRAYGEVDRTRQELKALKAQLATQAKEHAKALRVSEQGRRNADVALARAQRELQRLNSRRTATATSGRKAVAKPAVRTPTRRAKA